ncbi:MAG: hypothetical protein J2P51_16290 [Hyphomicrobiaceae bacterium]|nr:hypothetical protein [Hyphomicrobiaceae bacterium]
MLGHLIRFAASAATTLASAVLVQIVIQTTAQTIAQTMAQTMAQTRIQTMAQTMAPSAAPQLAPKSGAKSLRAQKPPVPPGRDPGGIAVALIGTGIDYTLPHIVSRLARDGEGELIGWDLQDGDRKPFDQSKGTAPPEWGGDGTLLASLIIGAPVVRLVPVRVDPSDPVGLAQALAFVAQTPARIAVIAMASPSGPHWEPFRQAAQRFRDVLVVVPAMPEPVYPAALGLDTVLAVAPGTARAEAVGFGGVTLHVSGAVAAVAAAASAAAELLAREPALAAAALKRRLGEVGGGAKWQTQR